MAGIDLQNARAPEAMRLYAVGDIHGRRDLLDAMLGLIEADLARARPGDHRIVFLGDYVDRGPDSRGALETVMQLAAADPRVVALCGNHEEGFLDFLADPFASNLFVDFGGVETAASYGVTLDMSSRAALAASHRALVAAVPAAHGDFMRALPRCASFGDYYLCHAGIRPQVALADQDPRDLIWIRREFLDHEGLYEKVVVHGHTPQREPQVRANRVNIDTRAFESGRLTAFVAEETGKRFLVATR